MPTTEPPAHKPTVVGVQAVYDAIARSYAAVVAGELEHKPLDRAMLSAFSELVSDGLIADIGCVPGHVTEFLACRPGAVALYSIIHLIADERLLACREFARAIRPGGWLVMAFHVDSEEFATGEIDRLTSWFGESVDVQVQFLEPAVVAGDLEAAGFVLSAQLERRPYPGAEYPSRRAYLLAQRS